MNQKGRDKDGIVSAAGQAYRAILSSSQEAKELETCDCTRSEEGELLSAFTAEQQGGARFCCTGIDWCTVTGKIANIPFIGVMGSSWRFLYFVYISRRLYM